MKLAIFLDVDLTITRRNIQETYATELGIKEQYEEIEKEFQFKLIDSAGFGAKLIALFATKNFSKTMAEDFFGKVELRDGVDKLFSLQGSGVDIFLVSSGPNYYVDVLAQRKGVPSDRILCSKYIFGEDGIISKCFAVEDRDKVLFVNNQIDNYDMTIGIGDNDRHDRFVDVCVVPMFMEPNEGAIHAPNFNAICTLAESLRRLPSPCADQQKESVISADRLKGLTLREALASFSVSLWMWIAGALVASFMAGLSADALKVKLFGQGGALALSTAPAASGGHPSQ